MRLEVGGSVEVAVGRSGWTTDWSSALRGPAWPGHSEADPRIHGGAYVHGSASDAGLDGSERAAQDGIIVVFVQYRLGVLGFLPPDGASTINDPNLAVRDVVLALNSVKANIAAVGGDPSRVTVGGQSAGASLTRSKS